ncbi:MAG: chemotaxis protein CheA [Hyphomicrobiales bacterium]|nr:chemotaxis protein CheA [Hyphomicrobiales bacterium]
MDDMEQFKGTYITECFELLEEMEERLLHLEEGASDKEELNAIFRCAHSIKGGAGAFGFNDIVGFTHILEALLDKMRDGRVQPTRNNIDLLLKSVDVVSRMVEAAQVGEAVPAGFGKELAEELEIASSADGKNISQDTAGAKSAAAPVAKEMIFYDIDFKPFPDLFASGNEPLLIIREVMRLGKAKVTAKFEALPELAELDPEKCYGSWNIELDSDGGEAAIREAFEFVEDECSLHVQEFGAIVAPTVPAASVAAAAPVEAVPEAAAPVAKGEDGGAEKQRVVSSIRVDLDKVDRLVNMVGELVITQAMLRAQVSGLPADQYADLLQGIGELSQHTRELQEAVMSVRMQPVKTVFSRMPRIVRDLASQMGKSIRIEMYGENTEIDKTVIEQLADPLTHMIRNSVDHGIESREDRIEAGKPEEGLITLSADHRGGRIIIEVSDDGRGINRERVLQKAIDKKLVDSSVTLSNEEIDNLVFHPGFSTAEQVTNVSGRGVGMDVVKRNIVGLGGTLELENRPGQGTTVIVSLPLTLAILDGMIVGVGREKYIIPINNIIESLRPKAEDVKHVADGGYVINVRGDFVPIIFLYDLFGIRDAVRRPEEGLIVLVETGRHRLGLMVDELVGQQQIVIKSLEQNTDPVEGISGATILGDGHVSLILDIAQLQQMAQPMRRVA